MTTITPQDTALTHAASDSRKYATIVYALYGAGFLIGITALAGLILAYIQRDKADAMTRTHFDFQIRTFWFGVATLFVSVLTMLLLIGYLIMLWWAVWTLVRVIKGYMALNEGRPIEDPQTWLW
jgi:uncharacterized membrane protein